MHHATDKIDGHQVSQSYKIVEQVKIMLIDEHGLSVGNGGPAVEVALDGERPSSKT